MPTYSFQMSAGLAGSSVSVTAVGSSTVVASGTLDANALFMASLPVGDYVAKAAGGHYSYSSAGTVAQADPDQMSDLNATYVGATAIADKAFGNNATDAKAHFQTLADKLSAAGGGTLFIPRGTYRMSGPLLVPSNVNVRGEGHASILKATFTGAGLIYNAGALTTPATTNVNITVSDLTVDGSGTANQGVAFAGVVRGGIHNVRIKGCTGYGIWLWAAGEDGTTSQGSPTKHVTVSGCHITDIVDTGIEADAAQSCTIVGNTVEATAGRGLYAWAGATDCTFMGNVVEGIGANNNVVAFMVSGLPPGAVGVYPRQTSRISFVGNSASNVLTALKVAGSAGNTPTDITLNANTVQTSIAASNGIYLDYCTRVMLDGNHVEGFTTAIRISDPSPGGTPGSVIFPQIQNNRFVGGTTSQIYKLTTGQLSGNLFQGQTNHALALQGCSGMVVSGNSITDPAATANTSGIVLYDYSAVPCTGNILGGNHSIDTRATKYLQQAVLLLGAADYNICTSNSARGAKAGAQAAQNAGTGLNNVLANNINA